MKKSVKFEIFLHDKNDENDKIYKELKDMQYKIMKASNKALLEQYKELMRTKEDKTAVPAKEYYGKSFKGYIYDICVPVLEGLNTANSSSVLQFAMGEQVFNKKELLSGESTLSTFKKDIPISIHPNNIKYIYENGHYIVRISLFNKEKAKEYGTGMFLFRINKPGDSQKAILNRFLSGEYSPKTGQISYDKRKHKWFLTVSYNFEPQIKNLNVNRILGVDLGIVNTATFAIWDDEKHSYDKLKWSETIISGEEVIHFRQKEFTRKQNLQKATKWASENKSGKGYKKRNEKANAMSDYCSRFVDTYNHKVSKYIVDYAEKHNCGCIQMENLSHFAEYQNNAFLKSWSYFDLQTKIKYKAEERGIIVIFINPAYTSLRCSRCGQIHQENRDGKHNQAKFECQICGTKANADENAAKNIALPNIEQLIEEELISKKMIEKPKKRKSKKVA